MTTQPAAPVARQPRLKRGEARVAGLLTAAEDLFAAKGYDGATMTEIAAAAGAAIGSLYQFFPTRQLLAEALHTRLADELSRTIDAHCEGAADRAASDLVDTVLGDLTAFLHRHPAFVTLTERRDIDRDRKLTARRRLRGQISGLLEASRDRVEATRARSVAALVLELMRSMILFSADDDPAVRDGTVVLLRGMLGRELGREPG